MSEHPLDGPTLPAPFRFGIGSLMLLTTLFGVLLGITVAAPGLGILLAIFSVPAYVRAWSGVARRQMRGATVNMGDKVMAFVGSLAVVVVIAISVSVTFFGTCLVSLAMFAVADQLTTSAGEPLIVTTLVCLAGVGLVSLIVPLGAGIFVARKLWPQRD